MLNCVFGFVLLWLFKRTSQEVEVSLTVSFSSFFFFEGLIEEKGQFARKDRVGENRENREDGRIVNKGNN